MLVGNKSDVEIPEQTADLKQSTAFFQYYNLKHDRSTAPTRRNQVGTNITDTGGMRVTCLGQPVAIKTILAN